MQTIIDEIYEEILFQDWVNGKNKDLHFEVNYKVLMLLLARCNLIERGRDRYDSLFGLKLKFVGASKGLELHDGWKIIALWEVCEKSNRLYRVKSSIK